MTLPNCCHWWTRFRQFAESVVAHDSVPIEFKEIERTTPTVIDNSCEPEASNRSWQNVIRNMGVAWESTAGSSRGRSAGFTNFVGSASAANDATTSTKPSSHWAAS